jgi:hypothetical protein
VKKAMRKLFRAPRGFNADGRTLGLGLAAAMAAQRRQATLDVEDYLRRNAGDEDRRVTTSV